MGVQAVSPTKIVITGAAGLVGQNLILRLRAAEPALSIVAIDKKAANAAVLRRLHPDITVVEADLAEPGSWQGHFAGADHLVIGHAQISALDPAVFVRNNLNATERVLEAATRHRIGALTHISSSVVNSAADDGYVRTKRGQEALVRQGGLPATILRPTLMFGWFDRKHLGWLARFMRRMPVFPIPGHGRYPRQPLYVGDFCRIVLSVIRKPCPGETQDISGQEMVDYVDLMRAVRAACKARCRIVHIPYGLFHALLAIYARLDRDPPFTTSQLAALVTPDRFAVTDWPARFGVTPTPLSAALEETFRHPTYSDVTLEF